MRSLPKPQLTASAVFTDSISKVKNSILKTQLQGILPNIIAASSDFETKAAANQLYTIQSQNNVGVISQKQLKKVYTGRMAKKGQPGRPHYDALINSSPNNRCPLCGEGRVKTLDHYLPKEKHPALVVTPLNLIPACKDCNGAKLAKVPNSASEETLHPYFDEVDDQEWLAANVINGTPTVIEYAVLRPRGWSSVKSDRVEKHFNTFELKEAYGDYAADHLISIRQFIADLFTAGQKQAVEDYLLEQEASYRNNYKNNWQAALYKALANNDDYCSGNF